MELRQLKYFVKSAEYLNFSEAAKHLFITQSTLSQQIKQLEFELGFALFIRNSRHIILTEAGEEFLPFAMRTIQDAEDGVQRLYDLQHVKAGTLHVGVTYSLSTVLTEGVLEFMKRYPGIKLEICYKTVNELLELLRNRRLDFVLSYKPLADIPEIDAMPMFENALAVVVNREHPLADKKKVKLCELQQYQLVLPAAGLQARMMLDRLMEKMDFELTSHVELNETNILLQLVAHSGYATILSSSAVFGNNRFKSIVLDEPGNVMEASLLRLKGTYQKASAKEFISILLNTDAVKRRLINWFD
ncbi:MAG: LysR family transcriptional regulator [Bacteroidaceae bacterium]|nr:LysR family transcriptional regulator [Bacteroidaceae bacterium]MBQ3539016.1 LysR family transcriptional regulator [Bacteroidaceae bacterium]MBQ6694396.1 LysR family transcriptional regulator [Bacteroidaceae bacterium]